MGFFVVSKTKDKNLIKMRGGGEKIKHIKVK